MKLVARALIPSCIALVSTACAVAQPAIIVVPGAGKDPAAFQQDAVSCRDVALTQYGGDEAAYDRCMAYHGNLVQQVPDDYAPPAYAYAYPYPFGYPFYAGGAFAGFAFSRGFPQHVHDHFVHDGFRGGGFHQGFHHDGLHGGLHGGSFHHGGFHGGFHGGGGFHH